MQHVEPIVSIIVPVYNTSSYLRTCLDSLVNQTYPHLEIICINDGSADQSLNIMREYEADLRVHLIDQTNRGCSFCLTHGINLATGEYIMFVDSDDWLDLDAIRVLVKNAERERADAVMGTYVREYEDRSFPKKIFDEGYLFFDEEETRKIVHGRLFGLVGEELAHPGNVDSLNTNCFTLYRRDLIKHLTFQGELHGTFMNVYFQIEALENCQRFIYVDYPVYHYRKTNAGSMSSVYMKDLVTSRLQFFDVLMRYIDTHELEDDYKETLYNRIALSMIGIGLNELSSPKTLLGQAESLRQVMRHETYKRAYSQINLHYFDMKWRTFFRLCNEEKVVPLVLMLHGIDYLRANREGMR